MNKEESIKFANEQLLGQGKLDAVDQFFSTNYIAVSTGKYSNLSSFNHLNFYKATL
jgi:hypothetical protein